MSTESGKRDKAAIRRAFDAAAETYDAAAVLQHEVGRRMLDRLDFIRLQPQRILDIGAGTGHATAALRKRYRKANVVAFDLSTAMLAHSRRHGSWLRPVPAVCGDAEALPFADRSVDLIFSSATFQWCADLDRLFEECQRVLRPDGLLMFSTFGPDTLKELRESWSDADGYRHVNRFVDMHDIGDALVSARFADPVMDMEYFNMTYASAGDLMRDLKAIGAQTVTGGRVPGLTGRARLQRMVDAYDRYRDSDGRLPATWEIVYGHAWATDRMPQRRDEQTGAVTVSLDAFRSSLKGGD
ncbi:malonyl-ACP O-methyltransferase BioC [Aquisalimonas asiatica]|uniref:Malonyl-[acyl-carrier protein] O-methyltransferase n=1 Tax=Aquisalimonas asiatica TaxID=406100 RepID=A0A1H8TK44_9GAMM|nr:malonyl-ACP O-methyltransferase BioC [Aquisalimonas asiatica]SEO91225.1 malonyl-CoA O-methyltransferase [Aquisalimonas asiatica]